MEFPGVARGLGHFSGSHPARGPGGPGEDGPEPNLRMFEVFRKPKTFKLRGLHSQKKFGVAGRSCQEVLRKGCLHLQVPARGRGWAGCRRGGGLVRSAARPAGGLPGALSPGLANPTARLRVSAGDPRGHGAWCAEFEKTSSDPGGAGVGSGATSQQWR